MLDRENSTEALRLLIAQRRMYDTAKTWAFLRTIGLSFIAIAAPIVTALYPPAAVAVGAAAALWIFLARTVFGTYEKRTTAKAAQVQELFDFAVYGMPELALREPAVLTEEIASLSGDDDQVTKTAKKENLFSWYTIDTELPGLATVAINQRANAAYSERLLAKNATTWLAVALGWSLVAVTIGLVLGIRVMEFLLGVVLPILPALLDVYEQWRLTKLAGEERCSLAHGIDRFVRGQEARPLGASDLLVWQEQLYTLRRDSPQIPNLLYKRTRKKNEQAMNAAVRQLAEIVKRGEGNWGSDKPAEGTQS